MFIFIIRTLQASGSSTYIYVYVYIRKKGEEKLLLFVISIRIMIEWMERVNKWNKNPFVNEQYGKRVTFFFPGSRLCFYQSIFLFFKYIEIDTKELVHVWKRVEVEFNMWRFLDAITDTECSMLLLDAYSAVGHTPKTVGQYCLILKSLKIKKIRIEFNNKPDNSYTLDYIRLEASQIRI